MSRREDSPSVQLWGEGKAGFLISVQCRLQRSLCLSALYTDRLLNENICYSRGECSNLMLLCCIMNRTLYILEEFYMDQSQTFILKDTG